LIASLAALTSSYSERKGDVETIDMSEDDDMKMSECGAERDSDDVNEITEGEVTKWKKRWGKEWEKLREKIAQRKS
jgi:hypothetical protein